jgi:hypothetical protein
MTKLPDVISMNHYTNRHIPAWKNQMAELYRRYQAGETIYVQFTKQADLRRTGSIGKLILKNECIQNLLYGRYDYRWGRNTGIRTWLDPDTHTPPADAFSTIAFDGYVKWDGRSNKVDANNSWALEWLPNHTGGTVWKWEKPEVPLVIPKDKLGREIQKGDFISYILYNFDNDSNNAGIYYGKVTKIEADGTVYATNIKLTDSDKSAEKKIKDNSLIVIMSKDLMDRLMLARLSS